MNENAPAWRLLYQVDYHAVLVDDQDEYAPEMEVAGELDTEAEPQFIIYRFSLDKLKIIDGYLVSDRYERSWPHPASAYEEWFVKRLASIASCIGSSVAELREAFTSDVVEVRAWAYESVGSCEGFDNLDAYPSLLSEDQFKQHWKSLKQATGLPIPAHMRLPHFEGAKIPAHMRPLHFDGAKMDPGKELFIQQVLTLYQRGITDSNYIARQIVDDYFRTTKRSIQEKQHRVEELVKAVLDDYGLRDDRTTPLNSASLPFDPFEDLSKRERLAIRQAYQSTLGTATAPTNIVKALERKGLVIRTGHKHEYQEWQKTVRSEPIFYLTPLGEEVAEFIVAKLNQP